MKLAEEGRIVLDDRDEWSAHQPSAADENAYLEEHGFTEYARWYLGIENAAAHLHGLLDGRRAANR
ncbi:hypothetical protein [Streptomyces sp. NPDC020917]|uniref:hypothetical protein n=1 Tax=Streptomyces sp. NPDC020917 TaxID=3365102 RepID=UPI003794BB4D